VNPGSRDLLLLFQVITQNSWRYGIPNSICLKIIKIIIHSSNWFSITWIPNFLHLLYNILPNVAKGTFLENASYSIIQSLKSLKLSLFSTINVVTFSIVFSVSQDIVKYPLCNNSSIFLLTLSLSNAYLGSTNQVQ